MSGDESDGPPPARRTFFAEPGTVLRGAVTNIVAGVWPSLYTRIQGDTGRGATNETPDEVAEYCRHCFASYFDAIGVAHGDISAWLQGKRVGEYGPGDNLGVALLLLAHGAEHVVCADRFALVHNAEWIGRVYRALLEQLEGAQRERGTALLDPAAPAGLDRSRVTYLINRAGTLQGQESLDLIISRAVLQHVWRPDRTLANTAASLSKDGLGVHLVDLRSLGRDRVRPLDFLTWSPLAYRLMASKKGAPNRWRRSRYLSEAKRAGLEIVSTADTEALSTEEVEELRPFLADEFSGLSAADLACLGFWLVVRKP